MPWPTAAPSSPSTAPAPRVSCCAHCWSSSAFEVEQPDHRTLMAFERPCYDRRVNDYVRVWADWSDIASTGELWLETLSGECMARSSTRCASVLDRICTGLNH